MAIDRRRRALLIAGAGGAAAFTTLGVAGYEKGPTWLTKRWIADLVRRSLPDTEIDAASLETFALEAAHAHPLLRLRERHVDTAWGYFVGLPGRSEEQQQLERELVSWFLTGSNFFSLAPQSLEPVFYAGLAPVCANMFATFNEDGAAQSPAARATTGPRRSAAVAPANRD